jgi:hypothetical protein
MSFMYIAKPFMVKTQQPDVKMALAAAYFHGFGMASQGHGALLKYACTPAKGSHHPAT